MQRADDVADDLPRVLLENYLMLAAAMESQNAGRLSDMLQYSQKVHHNLLEVMQQIEDAPMLAMTAGGAAPPQTAGDAAEKAEGAEAEEEQQGADDVDEQAAAAAGDGGGGDADVGDADTAGQGAEGARQEQPPPPSLPSQQPPQLSTAQGDQQQQQPPQPQQQQPPQPQQQQPPQQPPLQPQQPQQPYSDAPSWLQHINVSVAQLLGSLGLSQFVAVLEQQQVDMAALQLLEERHLREMGLPIGAVVKIKAALAAQQGSQQALRLPPPQAPEPPPP